MAEAQLESALDLMKHLPPQNIKKHSKDLRNLVPDLSEDIEASVRVPLEIGHDAIHGKDYILCYYNREDDSYRSPWSNQYDPCIEDGGERPSPKSRQLEIALNFAFEQYTNLYFDFGGVSSVYIWDDDYQENLFNIAILMKSEKEMSSKGIKACWDSAHVLEVLEMSKYSNYKLTSTVLLWVERVDESCGAMKTELGGIVTREIVRDIPTNESATQIVNIGELVEEVENGIRKVLTDIYFSKVMEVVKGLRHSGDSSRWGSRVWDPRTKLDFHAELSEVVEQGMRGQEDGNKNVWTHSHNPVCVYEDNN